MPRHNWFEEGSYNMTCDTCGRVFKSGEMMLRWDNAWVDSACWEPRHPQDFVRGIPDNQSVPYARPRNLQLDDTHVRMDGGYISVLSGPWQSFATEFQCTVKVALDDWTPPFLESQVLFSNWNSTDGGFRFYVEDVTGHLRCNFSRFQGDIQNITSGAAPTVANGATLYVRVSMTLNGMVTFYTSTDGTTYTQLGAASSTGAGVSFYTPQGYPYLGAGDATGTLPTIGKMYECEILAGSQRLFFNAALGAEHATQLQSGSLLFALNGDAEFVVP